MATKYLEPGGSATFDLSLWSSTFTSNGTVAPVTTPTTGQLRSIGCTNTTQGTNRSATVLANNTMLDAGACLSFYFNIDTLPVGTAANINIIASIVNNVNSIRWGVSLGSDGLLRIVNSAGTGVGTGTTVIAVNTWYRFTCAYTITDATHNTIKLFLSPPGGGVGISEISVTNTTTGTGTTQFRLGMFSFNCTGLTINAYFSDVYVNDSTSLSDTGDIRVTPKRPSANGTTNGFTTQIGSGGSGYGTGHSPQVNERALSTTNGWSMIGAGSAITEEYTIEGPSTGDVNISNGNIIDYMGWVYAKSALSETGSIVVGGVSSNIALTNANTAFMAAAGATSYPAGGTDIGIVTSTTVTTVSLYECGLIFAYRPITSNLLPFFFPVLP